MCVQWRMQQNFRKLLTYSQQYLQYVRNKMQLKIIKYATNYVCEFLLFHWLESLPLQWINPKHQCVCLFIRSSKILVSSPYFKVTDVCLYCSDDGIGDNFCYEFAFHLKHINVPYEKLYLGGCTNIENTMSKDSTWYAFHSSRDG